MTKYHTKSYVQRGKTKGEVACVLAYFLERRRQLKPHLNDMGRLRNTRTWEEIEVYFNRGDADNIVGRRELLAALKSLYDNPSDPSDLLLYFGDVNKENRQKLFRHIVGRYKEAKKKEHLRLKLRKNGSTHQNDIVH